MAEVLLILGYVVIYCLVMWLSVFVLGTLAGMLFGWGGEGSIGYLVFAPILPVLVPCLLVTDWYVRNKWRWRRTKNEDPVEPKN
ncbi:MAG: hypothetical protein HY226_04975 [Candidatus Vogelbacteria bacterium]|nr:hypothetical protein [Candidatus Vogelbacteria bacterium]